MITRDMIHFKTVKRVNKYPLKKSNNMYNYLLKYATVITLGLFYEKKLICYALNYVLIRGIYLSGKTIYLMNKENYIIKY